MNRDLIIFIRESLNFNDVPLLLCSVLPLSLRLVDNICEMAATRVLRDPPAPAAAAAVAALSVGLVRTTLLVAPTGTEGDGGTTKLPTGGKPERGELQNGGETHLAF